ncbi:MAG TPA: hypothetical protein VNS19_14955 [Acidimicrobiales bacterium]|nr:hypothetical protein [Acidimicrobiales bacterium]
MKRTHRIPLAVALALVTIGAASCGASAGPEVISDPRPTSTTSEPTPDPAGGDEIVWQEFTRGGFVPAELALGQVPAVTIYADGRIIVATRDADFGADTAVDLQEDEIPAADLEAFLADAEGSGLFRPGTDYGDPMITDLPSTSVTLRTGGVPATVDVYALEHELDHTVGGVSAEQAARRAELKQLLAEGRALATDPKPYVPERVRANLFPPPTVEPDEDPVAWPGPPRSAFPELTDDTTTSCLVIEGPDAAEVAAASAENEDGFWTIDGAVAQITVTPLLPGNEGCPPR